MRLTEKGTTLFTKGVLVLRLFINALFWYCKFGHNCWVFHYWPFLSPCFFFNCECTVQAHRPHAGQTTSPFSSRPWERCAACSRWLVCSQSITPHPTLFYFPRKIRWGAQLHSNELTPICLSSYAFCVFDCEGDVLEGVHGLHLTWCGLSRFFSVFIIEMD